MFRISDLEFSICNLGTLPSALHISIALTSLLGFLASMFEALTGSSFFKISKSSDALFFSNFPRSLGFGGTSGICLSPSKASI
ncbi:MAG: hypothetical protein A2431_03750 [Candidatus Zambryskibacteria bacterium RIFOXYC1_FULL_39_10]|uniref:Uncharacterized protein n=1 Tax=Candidatus Zambryskibacteria bacterium RIFOXYC1_FULL_39_10 TaxID=1802779 RepID=A0A1G2V170_9BACT|nr:MAG: hypothetical protein A2431_03750 [Candidatus Zambryskibacteria bacterium RIFOXYC1_FULL_39_10]OHB16465.1 MAG: hypothetical protein A2605_01455 [Candidatus Zambryskibacteria bacterium RIFOXYD1_FULL_39_35]